MILVTGASGRLGRTVVSSLVEQGMPARGLGRRAMPPGFPAAWARADLLTGEGLQPALHGVRTVIHCASDPLRPDSDPAALARLIDASRHAAAPHLIYVGIAGIERAARRFPYYAAKLRCEQALAASALPHTILRATQFHPFVAFLLWHLDARFALMAPTGITLQPVAVEFVASRLVHYASIGAAGRARDVHGPAALSLGELGRLWLRAQGRRAPVVSLPLPIQPFRAFAALDPVAGDDGGLSWRDWLSRRWPGGSDAVPRGT